MALGSLLLEPVDFPTGTSRLLYFLPTELSLELSVVSLNAPVEYSGIEQGSSKFN